MTQQNSPLTTLFTRLIDSRDGYREALQKIDSPFLASLLRDFTEWREREIAELRVFLRQKGIDVDDEGSLLASAHRVFLDLKDRVTGSDDRAAVDEIVRGEEYLLDEFDQAITEASGSDPEYRFLVREHGKVEAQIATLKARMDVAA